MNDERDPRADELQSLEQIARVDAYLDRLVADQRPAGHEMLEEELAERIVAAQLRLTREGVEAPTPSFLDRLEMETARAAAREAHTRPRPGLSRGRFLRGLATLAGGVGLGVAGVEGAAILQEEQRPHTLIVAGNERWYDVAAIDEVPPGGIKPFSAGGLLGFLMNDDGRLHAVSAICTHMGCRLKPVAGAQGPAAFGCLCHGSTFTRAGDVVKGLAPSALPVIALRVEKDRVLALGTRETV
jgi:Rieske Fe-S protein